MLPMNSYTNGLREIHPSAVFGVGVLSKGVIMGFVIGSVDLAFTDQLILVIVSATVTGFYALLVTWYSLKQTNKIHDRLDRMEQRQANVAAAVGADPESPPQPHSAAAE